MRTALIDYTEKLNQNVTVVSDNSKDTIQTMINSASEQFKISLDSNQELIESLEKKIHNKGATSTSLISEVKKTFNDSVELSEETIDYIIDIHNEQLQSNIDANLDLINTIKTLDFQDKKVERELLEKIIKNFEDTTHHLNENTKKMANMYNKHINLSINFNKKISKTINNQLGMLNGFRTRNMDSFMEWWKTENEDELTAL